MVSMVQPGNRRGGVVMDPAHFRRRAEETSTQAVRAINPEGRARLLQLAALYMQLAEMAEQASEPAFKPESGETAT